MDPVTHGLAGAAVNLAVVSPSRARPAALCGGLAALSADLDVLLSLPSDPLFTLEAHRHATHALPMAPLWALVVAGVLWGWGRRYMTFAQLYWTCLGGLATAGVLDACTSYGTRLFWPLWPEPVAWNLVSVFDPLCTVGLLAGVVLAARRLSVRPARWGLVWIAGYLVLAAGQQVRATEAATALARSRGHDAIQWSIKPTMGNTLLWSARYLTEDSLHAAAVHLPLGSSRALAGEAAARLDWEREYQAYEGTVLYTDIGRFDRLSGGWLVRHPDVTDVIGDGRYAMLPTSIRPLWGITVDVDQPDRHVPFDSYRNMDRSTRQRFVDLLRGGGSP